MRTLLAALILLAITAGIMVDALAEGEHFPIFVRDGSGNAVTGALVKAATWGSRPPSYIGTATEQGHGAYYFKVGSACGGCIPAGYYDLWRDGVLDSAYAGVYVGLGNVPPANSITSSHIVNGTIDLTADVDQTYGTSSTRLTGVFAVDGLTKNETTGDNVINRLTLDNSGTASGVNPRDHVLDVSYSTDMSDSLDAGMGVGVTMRSNQAEPMQSRYYVGPSGVNVLLNGRHWGTGFLADVRTKGASFGSHIGRHARLAGAYVYVAGDSGSIYWNPNLAGNLVGGYECRVHAHRMGEAWGFIGDVYGDSTVSWAHGLHARVYGDGSTYPKIAYGAYAEAHGQGEAYGVKTMCKTYGKNPGGGGSYAFHGECDTDTTAGLAYAHGLFVSCLSRPPGQNQGHDKAWGVEAWAGADTVYGGYFEAYSDLDRATNRARGVEAMAVGAPSNIGVLGHVDQAGNGYFSATNHGVKGWARSGAYNYGVRGQATSPTTGGINYGVYGWADSAAVVNYAVYGSGATGPNDWGVYSTGKGHDDSLLIGTTSNITGYRERLAVKDAGNDGVGAAIDVRGGTASTGLWIFATDGAENDYNLYQQGGHYGIYQSGIAENVLIGETNIYSPVIYSPLNQTTGTDHYRWCGMVTIPSGADSLWIDDCHNHINGLTATDVVIVVTAVNRRPDTSANGGELYVGHIGWGPAGWKGFTIYADTTQAADQKVYWRMDLQ